MAGWEGLYEVSDLGQVRSLLRRTRTGLRGGQVLKPRLDADGYLLVNLSRDGIKTTEKVHRLVAGAFLGPCPPGKEVCHNRPNSRDCAEAANLRYGTRSENIQQAVQEGTHWTGRRDDDTCGQCGNPLTVSPGGRRRCLRCEAKGWSSYYERNGDALNARKRAKAAARRAERQANPVRAHPPDDWWLIGDIHRRVYAAQGATLLEARTALREGIAATFTRLSPTARSRKAWSYRLFAVAGPLPEPEVRDVVRLWDVGDFSPAYRLAVKYRNQRAVTVLGVIGE